MKLILTWLKDGEIPLVRLSNDDLVSWLYVEDAEPPRWQLARSRSRALVPIIEKSLSDWIELFQKPLPDGVIYLSVRAMYAVDDNHRVDAGAAIFDGVLDESQVTVQEGDAASIGRWLEEKFEQRAQRLGLPPESRTVVDGMVRACDLLLQFLDESQASQLMDRGDFVVRGKDGRRYLVTKRRHGNVWLLNDEDNAVGNYCIVNEAELPVFDQMLGQKLLLENDIDLFLSTANYSELREPLHVEFLERHQQQVIEALVREHYRRREDPDPYGFREALRGRAAGDAPNT